MQKHRINHFFLLGVFLLSSVWCNAKNLDLIDGYNTIPIHEKKVESLSRGSSIQASIDVHTLTIVFTENLGQVAIEITTVSGTHVDCMSIPTPNGFQFYVINHGDYIVSFTLPNGDEYYGEFSVID